MSLTKSENAFSKPQNIEKLSSKPKNTLKWFKFFYKQKSLKESVLSRETLAKRTLQELLIYCIFLTQLVFINYERSNTNAAGLDNQWKTLFNRIEKVTSIYDFWNFMENDLIEGLHWETQYNEGSKKAKHRCPNGEPAIKPCILPLPDQLIMYNNMMLGVPRIKQNKVTNDSCLSSVPLDFSGAIKVCYAPYQVIHEEKLSFPPINRVYTELSVWEYQDLIQGIPFQGQLTTYGQGGYSQNLSFNKSINIYIIKELKSFRWINQGTRLVTIEFSTYNANVNLFSFITIACEFPATGGVMGGIDIEVMSPLHYTSTLDFVRMGVEILFCLFTIYYIWEEIQDFRVSGLKYFVNVGNILDIGVTVLSLIYIVLNIFLLTALLNEMLGLLERPWEYVDMSYIRLVYRYMTYSGAGSLFMAWLKLLKYLSFNKTMQQFSGTLKHSSKNLSGFSVMFCIVFFSFAQLGYLLFGTQAKDYRNFTEACFTLLRTTLGDFNYDMLINADSTFGVLFFLTYLIFVFFIFMNVFLAIIYDSYKEFKVELFSLKPKFEMGDFLNNGLVKIQGIVGVLDRSHFVRNAVKLAAEDDGFVTYLELREMLKQSNFGDMEIDLIFLNLSKDPEVKKILCTEDLDEEDSSKPDHNLESVVKGNERAAENVRSRFENLERKMTSLEMCALPLQRKLDSLLIKLWRIQFY
ncbi:polycystic kidney disease 2-like 1 protein isoform X2 [Eurytemora carolleeae]|uniref:polycystic kidney disease 2-like 1 protein isoform X2 n=1 Tax=Eurytemora carolleeae TaxID=1294199 RepID=UPI000C77D805|nr:polycystic kidney disease 2-like 1 protein isoform X2 [Eurytemora carolleeae]|eukprot:XP_023346219.1 polycystic kidney disease 2-like 1 protein isoform X2 [Eurytemora affinis]